MNQRQAFSSFFWWGLLSGLALGGSIVWTWHAFLPATAPAAVRPAGEKPKSEADLARTSLTDGQYDSLRIQSQPVKTVPVQQHLKLQGWIMAPQGGETVVSAPVSGYVRSPTQGGAFLAPLQSVRQAQALFVLEPVPTPVEQAQLKTTMVQIQSMRRNIEGELAKARDSVTLARSEQKRAEDLVASKLRGEQDLEQARTRLKHAEVDLSAAEDKLRLFDASFGNLEKDLVRPQTLSSSQGGVVLAVPVSPGQFVLAGTPLATIADLAQPWVRVPVAEQDLQRINTRQDAEAQLGPHGKKWTGTPVGIVPLVDPARHTADLLYRLSPASTNNATNQDTPSVFAKDLMIAVQVPLHHRQPETVVPTSAIVHDAYGGTWLYLETASGQGRHQFERRRVELGPVVTEGQIVRPQLSGQDRVVVNGAQGLYNREFHKPPAATP